MIVDKELKIWAAGAFDGEGSALIEKTGVNSYQIVVAVANTDPRVTTPVMEAWGGHYRANQDINKYSRDGSVRKKDYSVYFSRNEAKRFLVDIFPYLRARKDEVLVVLKALYGLPEEKTFKSGKKRLPRGSSIVLKLYYEELQTLHSNR